MDSAGRDDRFGTNTGLAEEDDALREAGRRKAPAALTFATQRIAQDELSPGLYFENYKPALAAYGLAARHGEPGAAPQLRLSV